ncbi:ParB/RepB/Spo0J family partition protein [Sulfitobacter porphyrae]|uniref:ParB/RepB/Spo0J family partition protein n=1 Tax=Sulfitobacter porphyrae TaxID=1246864 RepID=A0ABW2B705_9RHOB
MTRRPRPIRCAVSQTVEHDGRAGGGQRQEKVLRLVDPARCVMWEGHNRAYDLLTEDNCRDLIDGILSQGQQEFPAIVRRRAEGQGAEYEVICGARRHFAVCWLRANNYPKFEYLIEERDLTDEEAFRLADIENRDREDISDLERARDYAKAVEAYYGG